MTKPSFYARRTKGFETLALPHAPEALGAPD